MLAALRDTDRVPGSVTTGTPIQRVSQVVVPPLYGIASSARSTVLNKRWYSGSAMRGKIASRSAAIPARSKPKSAAMPGQIDENVDSIAVDRLCQTGIGHGSHVTPEMRARTHLLRDVVRLGAGRVAKDLASGAVVPFEQGDREKRDRVGVEIA